MDEPVSLYNWYWSLFEDALRHCTEKLYRNDMNDLNYMAVKNKGTPYLKKTFP